MNSDQSKREYNLQERLIAFSILCMTISENMFNTRAGSYISQQLMRSGTSPALNYGEAQAAESRKDFIHKMKIILKELRESLISLIITKRKPLIKNIELIDKGIQECKELVAIFATSITTAEKNDNPGKLY
jgi:four helix bundle protein